MIKGHLQHFQIKDFSYIIIQNMKYWGMKRKCNQRSQHKIPLSQCLALPLLSQFKEEELEVNEISSEA